MSYLTIKGSIDPENNSLYTTMWLTDCTISCIVEYPIIPLLYIIPLFLHVLRGFDPRLLNQEVTFRREIRTESKRGSHPLNPSRGYGGVEDPGRPKRLQSGILLNVVRGL